MNTRRCFRIKVRGRLSDRLGAAFEGITLVDGAAGSELVGEIVDQAQLHGLLCRIRDLGLDLEGLTITDAREGPAEQAPVAITAAADRITA
jgi:hypothetical protein